MNDTLDKKILPGLRPLPYDPEDFSHSQIFGALPKSDLPEKDFLVSTPFDIKDQSITGNTEDFCTAYAAAAVSEDQEGVQLNPEFLFMKSKVLSGNPKEWGQDLRFACKAAVKFGTIEQQYYPYLNRPETERDVLVDPLAWSEDLASLAYEHRKNTFFAVDGPHDTFDNFRMTLWQNRGEMRSILTGSLWYDSWTKAPAGIIPKEADASRGSGHAFKIFGQHTISGEIYLVAQLSSGPNIGENGLFYFPREVVNREFRFGAFTFRDMPKDVAQYFSENKISIHDGLFTKVKRVFSTIISNHFSLCKDKN